jgi:hypothetical protein
LDRRDIGTVSRVDSWHHVDNLFTKKSMFFYLSHCAAVAKETTFSSEVDGDGGASPFPTDSAGGATLYAASVGVGTAAGATADAVAGASVVAEVSSDGADSGTGGVGGADSSSLLVSFVFLGMKIAAAAGAAADAVK